MLRHLPVDWTMLILSAGRGLIHALPALTVPPDLLAHGWRQAADGCVTDIRCHPVSGRAEAPHGHLDGHGPLVCR